MLCCFTAAFVSGCVPSASEPNTTPRFTILSTFFNEQDSTHSVLWHRKTTGAGDQYFLRWFDHSGPNKLSAIFPTVSYFHSRDTVTKQVTDNAYMIADSIVIEYVSTKDTSVSPVTRLHGFLEKGASFDAAKGFVTSNGATINIIADVDDYFGAYNISGSYYIDVFHITYTVTDVTSSTQPLEPEYQKGATLGVYYVKTIGPVYKIAKDPTGATVWSEEVLQTYSR